MTTKQSILLNCPGCCSQVFQASQEFDEQNHRVTIKLQCPDCKTIIYADTAIELSTRFPDKP